MNVLISDTTVSCAYNVQYVLGVPLNWSFLKPGWKQHTEELQD